MSAMDYVFDLEKAKREAAARLAERELEKAVGLCNSLRWTEQLIDALQKDRDEYNEEMSFGGRPFKSR